MVTMPLTLALLLGLAWLLFLLLPKVHSFAGELSNADKCDCEEMFKKKGLNSDQLAKTALDAILNSDVDLERLVNLVIKRLTPKKLVQILEKSSKEFLTWE